MIKKTTLLLLACAILAPTLTWAHTVNRPAPPTEFVKRPEGYSAVVADLRAWDTGAARKRLAALERAAPGVAEWRALTGAADYLDGKFAEAMRNLEAALRKKSGDGEWLELRLHVRQTQAALEGFQVHRTPHFDIWHDPAQDALLMPYLEDALEKAHAHYAEELGVQFAERVRVEVFSDSERFHKSSTLSRREIEEKGAVGLCKFNKLMILSPGTLLRGYRWLDAAAHEYVHYLVVRATRNRAPIWLHEGIAKYLERKWRGKEMSHLHPGEEALLHEAREANRYIPFKKMEPSLIYLDTPRDIHLAYAEAASAVDFIRKTMGPNAIARMLRGIRESGQGTGAQAGAPGRASLVELESTGPPQSAVGGLLAVAGVDLERFEQMWIEHLAKLPLRPRAGARVSQPKLKPKGPVSESAIDLAALKSAVARKRMRLGDRLSFRGRMRAALIEYRRALRDEPYSQPLLNRAAQVEIRLGMISQAERHIRKALEVDPDYATTYVHKALASEIAEKPAAALAAWEEVLQINPFIRLVHERLAAHYESMGDTERAKRAREALRLMAPR